MEIDKSIIDDFITFTKNNPVYLFCSLIYYVLTSLMLGGTFLSFLIALVLYAGSMIAVFSVIGETILCFLERARKVETRKEKEYLLPIFEEVYQEVKLKYPNLHYIEICIIDNMSVNACALGTSTVAVTKGALETFTEDELKGILAHEIAHIINFDTIASLYIIVGNGLFSIFVIIAKFFLSLLETISSEIINSQILDSIVKLFKVILLMFIFALSFILQLALSSNSRNNEYRADKFAYYLGYGNEIVDAFYLLEKISLGDNSSVIERMVASHPRITARIEQIEELIENENP